jgi:redox-sensitive bicupin YhaK (pirin superfamily)
MITIRRSGDRGQADHGWLKSRHSFSFAEYYDPQFMGFRSLRVINEDRVAPGGGFPTHPHRDMEIITYVISGALRHEDSLGHRAVMKAGDVQRISAGTGVAHSEFNNSRSEPVHFLQIWITPERRDVPPHYAEKSFAEHREGIVLVASHDGRNDSIPINQDADVLLGKMQQPGTLVHALRDHRHAWLQLFAGSLSVNGQTLEAGDAAALNDEPAVEIQSREPAEFLLFDLS